MNGSSLRSRIQDERAKDPRFRRGYQLCSELAIALIVIRLLSPAMGWFTSHIVPDFMADVIFPLLMGVCIFFSSRDGQRRFSGWLCILIGVATICLGWANVEVDTSSVTAFIACNRYTQYQIFLSLLCIALGLVYLTNPAIRAFGKRCQEFTDEINGVYKQEQQRQQQLTGAEREAWVADKKRQMNRAIIFAVIAGTLLALLGAGMTGVFSKKLTFDKLVAVEGGYVSIRETSVENTYRITLTGQDEEFGVSNIYNFPAEQFASEVEPGDTVLLHCKPDQWHTIMQLEANGVTYLSFDETNHIDRHNTMMALVLILCFYVGLMAIALILYFYKRNRLLKKA